MSSAPIKSDPCPPTEVSSKATRRTFSVRYKLKILQLVEACSDPAERGALLRREGLYHSHLAKWRESRDRGELATGGGRKRGPTPRRPGRGVDRIAELERENAQLAQRLHRAEAMVELQKKVAAILGSPLLELTACS